MATTRSHLETVLTAASVLARAGQWELATDLLDTCADDPQVRLARATQAVWRDFWQGTDHARPALAAAEASAGGTEQAYRLESLVLERDYFQAISDGGLRLGAENHPPALRGELTERAARLHESAPTDSYRGWAAFWRGVIADNIASDHALARECYLEARALAEREGGDDELAAEALRHLGVHARRQADHDQARLLWERATELRQRASAVPGALSQQLALAQHAADVGDPDRAAAIAGEVSRWAEALQLPRLAAGAQRLR